MLKPLDIIVVVDTYLQGDNMTTYKIKKGDTLSDIAKKYKTTVRSLQKQNNIKDINKIRAGQQIQLGTTTSQLSSARPDPYKGIKKSEYLPSKKKPKKKKVTAAQKNQKKMPTKSKAPEKSLWKRLSSMWKSSGGHVFTGR